LWNDLSIFFLLTDVFAIFMSYGLNSMRDILPKIEELVVPIVERAGCELVEIAVAGVGTASVLRVFVHRAGGISVDEIAKISHKISETLDSADIIHQRYFLEVSSPGLDRPLRSVRDFVRAISEKVRIVEPSGETIEGELIDANAEMIFVRTDDGIQRIPLEQIAVGKIIY